MVMSAREDIESQNKQAGDTSGSTASATRSYRAELRVRGLP
jgi:hypothetical protein